MGNPGETDYNLTRNAGRLLREQWRTPTALAQELYTVLSDKSDGAVSSALPAVQERAKAAEQPPLPVPIQGRSATPQAGIAHEAPGVPLELPSFTMPPLGGFDASGLPGRLSGPSVEPEPLRTKPYKMDPPFPDYDYNLSLPLGGGTSDFIGQVVGGDGDQPQVQLYPNGSGGAPGDTVTVNILQLLPTETIPNGTWITGIQQFPDPNDPQAPAIYEAQIPIWLQ